MEINNWYIKEVKYNTFYLIPNLLLIYKQLRHIFSLIREYKESK
jgi:hypothetical protein